MITLWIQLHKTRQSWRSAFLHPVGLVHSGRVDDSTIWTLLFRPPPPQYYDSMHYRDFTKYVQLVPRPELTRLELPPFCCGCEGTPRVIELHDNPTKSRALARGSQFIPQTVIQPAPNMATGSERGIYSCR